MWKIFKNHRPFRLTRGGWIFVLYTIGIGAGAINTGNNLLYLIFGIFLGLIMASGVLSDLNLWRLDGSIELPPSGEAQRGNFLVLRLANRKGWMPSISITAEIEIDLRETRIRLSGFFPSVPKNGTMAKEVAFTPPHRGYFEIRTIRVFTRFPFGLLRKEWTLKKPLEQGAFIFPPLGPVRLDQVTVGVSGHEAMETSDNSGESVSMRSIRPYRYDDNPKFIHWRASAKRGSVTRDLMSSYLVREMERDDQKQLLLLWPHIDDFAKHDPADAERLIEMTASVIHAAGAAGHSCRLVLGEDPKRDRVEVVRDPMQFLAVFEPADPPGERARRYLRRSQSGEAGGISMWRYIGEHRGESLYAS